MNCIVLLFIFVLGLLGYAESFNERIVGGTDAEWGDIPYIVNIKIPEQSMILCAGVIISSSWIITAGHCTNYLSGEILPPERFSIQYGVLNISRTGNLYEVEKVIVHEKFNWLFNHNDIALMKLKKPINFTEYIQPVKLPEQDQTFPDWTPAIMSGWGYNDTENRGSTRLQKVEVLAYSQKECENAHGDYNIKPYHMCAGVLEGGKGHCTGDSGGPLVINDELVGIISWHLLFACAHKDNPSVLTRVAKYRDWIKEKSSV